MTDTWTITLLTEIVEKQRIEIAALITQLQDSTDHMCWLNAQRIMAEKRAEDAEAKLRVIE